MAPLTHFLRPYAIHIYSMTAGSSPRRSVYLRLYELTRQYLRLPHQRRTYASRNDAFQPGNGELGTYTPEDCSALTAFRIRELQEANALSYPRLIHHATPITVRQFRKTYEERIIHPGDTCDDVVSVSGRLYSVRRLGSKLVFITLRMDGMQLQGVINWSKLVDETDQDQFRQQFRLIQRGDHISITGHPVRSDRGELCVQALYLPRLLSPTLAPLPHHIPSSLKLQQRHMELIINRTAEDFLRARSCIIAHLRRWLETDLGCWEVQTPILAANAGGAIARPFTTTGIGHDQKLALRVAPELWLKRLVVSGFDRVYEIGPVFRNEGVDHTHNPEFTMCEFYLSYYNLEQMMRETRKLFSYLAKAVPKTLDLHGIKTLSSLKMDVCHGPWKVLDFIPTINAALGRQLPDLEKTPNVVEEIIKLLQQQGKSWHKLLGSNPTLSKLLDHIAAAVLESQFEGRPIFIIKHPACMSPLAKTFKCPLTDQLVSARAEVFFNGNELANMYEEENCPFSQRRKLIDQAESKRRADAKRTTNNKNDSGTRVDEHYLSVLMSGLPPTAGWGCGVDRLVMLFTGATRISDVLSFGNLRNVVGLASPRPQPTIGEMAADVQVVAPDPATEEITRKNKAGKGGGLEAVALAPKSADNTMVTAGEYGPDGGKQEKTTNYTQAGHAEHVAKKLVTHGSTKASETQDAADNALLYIMGLAMDEDVPERTREKKAIENSRAGNAGHVVKELEIEDSTKAGETQDLADNAHLHITESATDEDIQESKQGTESTDNTEAGNAGHIVKKLETEDSVKASETQVLADDDLLGVIGVQQPRPSEPDKPLEVAEVNAVAEDEAGEMVVEAEEEDVGQQSRSKLHDIENR